jgi:hypothetical protein
MFKAQLEGSGFPQLLPGLLGSFTAALQAGDVNAGQHLARQALTLLQIQHSLDVLLGLSFLSTLAAGPTIVKSMLRFAHASVQYMSKVVQQTGLQDLMSAWLRLGCNIAILAAAEACLCREGNSEPSSGSSSSSSSAISTGGTSKVSQSESESVSCADLGVRWLCLMVLTDPGTLGCKVHPTCR